MIGIERNNGNNNNNSLQPNGIADLSVNLAAAERARQRRRCSSAALVVARNNAIQKPKRMTPRQCHLVIKSWSKRSPKNRVAKDIFAAIFMEAEELKSTFGIDTGSAGKKLRSASNFVAHTNIFTDTLDFVIRNLDDLSLVTENAEQLGRRHAGFPVDGGFRPEYWNIFTECICEGVCAAEEDKESCVGWRLLVQTIVYYMKLGYDRERLRIQRHSSFRRSASPLKAPHELPEAMEQQSLAAHNGHRSPTPQQLLGVTLDEYR
uniref:GLOBIN domain-containing protein n=1 Tax=Globodera pallida TaxID=36090 RepID=A0A183BXT3_GLOPA